jgi:opacity protein-like surface antigen
MFHPYLIAGGGAYNVKLKADGATDNPSETKIGINAGAGFDYSVGSATVFIEGRFHNVFMGDASDVGPKNLSFVPITIGVKFGG